MKREIKLQSIQDDDGQLISPGLPNGVKNYLIDIDGTVTDDVPNEEPERMKLVEPFPDALEILNKWYDEGHVITFFTWLDKWGFKYHNLLMGKPRGGNYHWVDNHIVKATQYIDKWTDLVQKEHTIEVFKD